MHDSADAVLVDSTMAEKGMRGMGIDSPITLPPSLALRFEFSKEGSKSKEIDIALLVLKPKKLKPPQSSISKSLFDDLLLFRFCSELTF